MTPAGRARRTRWTRWSGWPPGPASRPGYSAFGPGRPGWHVECAAIATEYLGVVFDVQAGGSDLIFPHHEMSASHARVALADGEPGGAVRSPAATRTPGMVRLDGEKMSKSLGNLVFVSRLLAGGVRSDGGPAGHPGAPLPERLGLDRRPGWPPRRTGWPAGGPR